MRDGSATDRSQTGTATLRFLASTDPSELDWADFVQRYAPRLLKICHGSFQLSRQASEHVTNEVLVRVFRSLPGFQRDRSFRAWLYGVVRYAVYDYYESLRTAPVSFPDAADMLLHSRDGLIEEIVMADVECVAKARVEGRVQARHWQAWQLIEVDCCSVEEVADRMGIQLETTRNYVSAVKNQIEREITSLCQDDD